MSQEGKSIWFRPIGGSGPPWWFWVLLLLVIAYLVWMG